MDDLEAMAQFCDLAGLTEQAETFLAETDRSAEVAGEIDGSDLAAWSPS